MFLPIYAITITILLIVFLAIFPAMYRNKNNRLKKEIKTAKYWLGNTKKAAEEKSIRIGKLIKTCDRWEESHDVVINENIELIKKYDVLKESHAIISNHNKEMIKALEDQLTKGE